MANREELGLIRGARAGRAESQLALGRRYLFGSAGLPHSLPTALHWLERAAQQGCEQAWQLIGEHIPVELARQSARPLTHWYERAYDGGLAQAGLVLAQLVLEAPAQRPDAALRTKAQQALAMAARAGLAEAQWLLARQSTSAATLHTVQPRWLQQAADGGVVQAQTALLDAAWEARHWDAYLERALPQARALAAAGAPAVLEAPQAMLLARCAQALAGGQGGSEADPAEIHHFRELAALANERHAQLAMGLWWARMQVDGQRVPGGSGSANFKKAIRWLTQAGEQGLAEAWYALSRIYLKPEFSQRNIGAAQAHLERAAQMGYRDAQFECGNSAWRARRERDGNDVRAVYWLQKAAAQGCARAAAALHKIAPRANGPVYSATGALAPGRDLQASHPLLAARLELAAMFRLTRAEALLLDIKTADFGHCLVIDIRASYGRSKRRLVLVDTACEREALDRIARLFEQIDSGPGGLEGNYRQRLYRLKSLVPAAADDEPDYELAA
ncbi:MAG: hypothetical protein V4508_23290 [Pseudomonadota bacterium]